MNNTTDSESAASAATMVRRNKGQTLVETYRLERIAQRQALRTELHERRQALREGRAVLLGAAKPQSRPGQNAAPAEPSETPKAASPEPAAAVDIGGSIFAGFCGAVNEAAAMAAAAAQAAAAPGGDDSNTPPASFKTEVDLPLSSIGFGPGMTLRMRQLGIQTVSELASSDPAWLRNALGEISQLINVDLWIANARKAAKGEASQPET
jgi:hypothetical protein